jgi:hypothetical protein
MTMVIQRSTTVEVGWNLEADNAETLRYREQAIPASLAWPGSGDMEFGKSDRQRHNHTSLR